MKGEKKKKKPRKLILGLFPAVQRISQTYTSRNISDKLGGLGYNTNTGFMLIIIIIDAG